MSITITIDLKGVTEAEAEQLRDVFQGLVPDELRKIRREFEVGDLVVDIFGDTMEIIRIECGLYDMDQAGEGPNRWRGADESVIASFKDRR